MDENKDIISKTMPSMRVSIFANLFSAGIFIPLTIKAMPARNKKKNRIRRIFFIGKFSIGN